MFKEKTGVCEQCKHIVSLKHMQRVKANVDGRDFLYCPEHKKPYDRIHLSWWTDEIHYYKTIPEQEIKVDETGKEIKQKK